MPLELGTLLASHDENADPGVWFVFYHDEDGVVAFDITREHPDIGYKSFEETLKFEDAKQETEKVVLAGGPERADDALIILHEATASTKDSQPLNTDFAFQPYTYVLKPGQKPLITTPNNAPTEINLKHATRFLIAMGYRIFDTKLLEEEIAAGHWVCLPATPDIVFNTPRRERRDKLIHKMN